MNRLHTSVVPCQQSRVPATWSHATWAGRLVGMLTLIALASACSESRKPNDNAVVAGPTVGTESTELSKPPRPADGTALASLVEETTKPDPLSMVEPPGDKPIAIPIDEATLVKLSKAVRSDDVTVRRAAVEALGRIGQPAVSMLAEALAREPLSFHNADYFEKELATLGETWMELVEQGHDLSDFMSGDAVPGHFTTMAKPSEGFLAVGMVPGFNMGMLRKTDLDGRRQAAEALGAIGIDALPHLMRAVRQDVRRFEGLQDVEDWDRAGLLSGWYLKRLDDDIRGIARVGPIAIPSLKKVIFDQKEEVTVRLLLVAALGEMGQPAIPTLSEVAYLDDQAESHLLRETAMVALGRTGEAAIPVLADLLQEGCVNQRRQAVSQLGKIGSENALPALTAALKDWDEHTRLRAVEIIGRIGTKDIETRSALSRLLDDPSDTVRRSAARALGKRRQAFDDGHGRP